MCCRLCGRLWRGLFDHNALFRHDGHEHRCRRGDVLEPGELLLQVACICEKPKDDTRESLNGLRSGRAETYRSFASRDGSSILLYSSDSRWLTAAKTCVITYYINEPH